MRIAVVSPTYLAAENRKNVAELARHATVRVVSPDAGLHQVFSDLIEAPRGEDARDFALYPPRRLAGSIYLLRSRDLGFAAFAPDIVHVEHDPWSAIFWQAAFCRARYAPAARMVVTAKKNTYRRYPGPAGRLKDRLARRGLARVDHVIAASGMTADLFRRAFAVPAARITVIHHLGVDTAVFAPAGGREGRAGRVRVGYCGRLEAHKGLADLVEATGRARAATGIDITLSLLGEGSLEAVLAAEAVRHEWVEVLPTVAQAAVAEFLRGLDIFVLPARVLPDHQEHDAHALLEALACGVASIGTRSGIIPEVLGDGTGLLAAPGEPRSIADALATLAADPARRAGLGRRGREKALRDFSLAAVSERKIEVYEHVLAAA